jgi:hypothetical protein
MLFRFSENIIIGKFSTFSCISSGCMETEFEIGDLAIKPALKPVNTLSSTLSV